jgi:hypothetical protein
MLSTLGGGTASRARSHSLPNDGELASDCGAHRVILWRHRCEAHGVTNGGHPAKTAAA